MIKKYLLTAALSLLFICSKAQECDMPLRVIIPSQVEALDETSANMIANKLRQIVTQNGIVGGSSASPFAITANVDVLTKEILPSGKYIYVLNVNLYIVDTSDKKIYSSTAVEVRCAGNSQTKAYVDGIRRLSANNNNIRALIQDGRKKILDYYDANYKNIIKRSQVAASMHNYEEALYNLMAVPECSKGYDAAMSEAINVYKQYVNRICDINLTKARTAWMSGYTIENAEEAASYLEEIYPDAKCYGDAQELVKEIKDHMGERWKFSLKQWDDMVSIEKQRMVYAREIAMAFANNQPNQVVDFIF